MSQHFLLSKAAKTLSNEVKGKSALALSRDLGLSYKSAFVLLHKLREAMAEEMRGRVVGGEGKEAEIDGGYFGGYVKPANLKEDRLDRRFASNQSGKRKVVVVIRERGGNSVPAVFGTESQASAFIRARIAKGTTVHADEAGSWDGLHDRFEMKRINHQEAYSLDGACTNYAEEYFSRLRRAEIGIPPPHCRRVSAPLCAGKFMAGGQPPAVERRTGQPYCLIGNEARQIS